MVLLSTKERRNQLCSRARRRARQRIHRRLGNKLSRMLESTVQISKLMDAEGNLTGNRSEWRNIIRDFGLTKHSRPGNELPK